MALWCLHNHPGGQIWVYNKESGVTAVDSTPHEFANSSESDNTFRLIGNTANANLIIELYYKQYDIQVVSPLVGGYKAQQTNIPDLLSRIFNCDLPPQLGGPHFVTQKDILSYKLATGHKIEHPLWSKMGWVRGLNKPLFHQLLGIITDPRWYVDLHNPNRLSKLYSYLKLSPYSVQTTLLNPNLLPPVISHWYNPKLAEQVRKNYLEFGVFVAEDSDILGLAPSDWPWRMWWALTDFGAHTAPDHNLQASNDIFTKAILKVSKRLVRFLYFLWMEWLYPQQLEWQFRSEDFLRYKFEVDSFDLHNSLITI